MTAAVNEWAFIGVFMSVAWILPALPLVISWLFRPRRANAIKLQTYECGVETVGDTWVQFKAHYYIYALVFVIFDVETVFLFPWAVAFGRLPLFAVLEGVLFILILAGGLVYAWRKGVLEWV